MIDTAKASTTRRRPSQPRAWIFQANPDRYRIHDSLQIEQGELWNLNQHAGDIHTGDRVLLWISGADAGIYAVGTVTSEAATIPDSPAGIGYWRDPNDGRRPKPRSFVHYDRLLLDFPLRKVYLQFDPELSSLSILHSPRGTNFAVTEEEWLAIKEWLDQT